jgi:hypothetical protein
MNFKFRDDEGTLTLLASITGLVAMNAFYFGLALPVASIRDQTLFWTFYVLWAMLSFLLALRDVKGNRRAREAFAVFALLLVACLGLAGASVIPVQVAASFPGFFAGIAVWSTIVLIKRMI